MRHYFAITKTNDSFVCTCIDCQRQTDWRIYQHILEWGNYILGDNELSRRLLQRQFHANRRRNERECYTSCSVKYPKSMVFLVGFWSMMHISHYSNISQFVSFLVIRLAFFAICSYTTSSGHRHWWTWLRAESWHFTHLHNVPLRTNYTRLECPLNWSYTQFLQREYVTPKYRENDCRDLICIHAYYFKNARMPI